MARIAGFLFGLLIGLAVFGVGALFFFPRGARMEKATLQPPSIAKIGLNGDAFTGKAVPEVSFEGSVELSPQVAAVLRGATRVTLTVNISQMVEGAGRNVIGRVTVDDPKFPLHYSVPWARESVVARIDKENLGSFNVDVVICVGRPTEQCYPMSLPRFGGTSSVAPKLTGTIASQPLGSPTKLDAGSTVVNLYRSKPDITTCVNAGFTISGTIKPTSSFPAKEGNNPRVALVMSPFRNFGVNEPFVNLTPNSMRPITRADMGSAEASGIAYTIVALAGAAGAPFTLKMPEGKELMMTSFVAVLCRPGEADIDCAARFYPALRSYALSYGDAGIFRLSPKDFHVPACGDKTVFYLNDWKLPAGTAGIDAYLKASPPEVVDGANL